MSLSAWFQELKRRRVFRAIVGWGVVSFALLQVAEPLIHALGLPESILKVAVALLGLGFPVTVILAWIFDAGVQGISRTPEAPGPGDGPTRPQRGWLALALVALGLAAATPGVVYFFVWPGPGRRPGGEAAAPSTAARSPSIAVLPFVDMSPGKDQEYFADGIAEEILSALAHVDGLRVTGRTSSFSFKGRNEDLRSIGAKLNVATVLEGSVRKEGNRVRITAQVVNVADGYHLWSQSFDRNLAGIFAVQDEIAQAVVRALQIALLPGQQPLTRSPGPENLEAHAQFLLGRQFFAQGTPDGFRRAVGAYEKAIALDPRYAAAWAGLANATFWLTDSTSVTLEAESAGFARALDAANKAMALDPELAAAYATRSMLRQMVAGQRDWPGALADVDRALALSPNDPEILIRAGVVRSALGRLPEAIDVLSRATVIDPLSAQAWWRLAWLLAGTGQLEEARNAAQRSLEVAPNQAYGARTLGFVYLLEGREEEALSAFRQSSILSFVNLGEALVAHSRGRVAEFQAKMAELASGAKPPCYQVAEAYAWSGDRDRAFEWLARSADRRDAGLVYLKFDPLLRSVRADPRWAAFLERMELPPD